MVQGDSYNLELTIKNQGVNITPEVIDDVEITLGKFTKTYAHDEVTYDTDRGKWLFPLSQVETFDLLPMEHVLQVRVLYKGGNVKGSRLMFVDVKESLSKTILEG